MVNNKLTYLVYKEKDIISGQTYVLKKIVDNTRPKEEYFPLLDQIYNLNCLLEEFYPAGHFRSNEIFFNSKSPLCIGLMYQEKLDEITKNAEVHNLQKDPQEIYNFIMKSLGISEDILTGNFCKDRENDILTDFVTAWKDLYRFGFQNKNKEINNEQEFQTLAKESRKYGEAEIGSALNFPISALWRERSLTSFNNTNLPYNINTNSMKVLNNFKSS